MTELTGGESTATPASGQPATPAAPAATGQPSGDVTSNIPTIDVTPSGDQHQTVHWMDSVPQGTFNERDTVVLKRFTDVPSLAKGYMNAFNLVARDKIPVPQNEQEFEEVYNRLGRPQDAKGYELKINPEYPDTFHKQMEGNQDWFKSIAHKHGLNKTQAQRMYSEYTDLVYKQQKAMNDKVQGEMVQALNTLKDEYGPAFDGKMVLANRAIDTVGGESLIKIFEESGLGRHPAVVKAFIKIGEMLGEETALDLDGPGGEANADLDAQIAEIQSDPAYLDAKNPQQKILVAKLQRLMAKRYPEERTPPGTIRLF